MKGGADHYDRLMVVCPMLAHGGKKEKRIHDEKVISGVPKRGCLQPDLNVLGMSLGLGSRMKLADDGADQVFPNSSVQVRNTQLLAANIKSQNILFNSILPRLGVLEPFFLVVGRLFGVPG